jgi:uncharacterized membrane-anchored protein YhcB (DUF1043 family)
MVYTFATTWSYIICNVSICAFYFFCIQRLGTPSLHMYLHLQKIFWKYKSYFEQQSAPHYKKHTRQSADTMVTTFKYRTSIL